MAATLIIAPITSGTASQAKEVILNGLLDLPICIVINN